MNAYLLEQPTYLAAWQLTRLVCASVGLAHLSLSSKPATNSSSTRAGGLNIYIYINVCRGVCV